MIGKVRRMHRRHKKSVREIARMSALSRNTVAKWLTAPQVDELRRSTRAHHSSSFRLRGNLEEGDCVDQLPRLGLQTLSRSRALLDQCGVLLGDLVQLVHG